MFFCFFVVVFFLFPGNWFGHFMKVVFEAENLHEMSKPISWKNKKNILKCRQMKILHRMLNVNQFVSSWFRISLEN